MAYLADAPGGGSLAFTARSHQFSSGGALGGRWRRCLDRQRVDVGFQQIADGGVHQTVTPERGYAAKLLGDNGDAEMTVATGCPRVACVQMALVLDHQERRGKMRLQAPAQALFAAG